MDPEYRPYIQTHPLQRRHPERREESPYLCAAATPTPSPRPGRTASQPACPARRGCGNKTRPSVHCAAASRSSSTSLPLLSDACETPQRSPAAVPFRPPSPQAVSPSPARHAAASRHHPLRRAPICPAPSACIHSGRHTSSAVPARRPAGRQAPPEAPPAALRDRAPGRTPPSAPAHARATLHRLVDKQIKALTTRQWKQRSLERKPVDRTLHAQPDPLRPDVRRSERHPRDRPPQRAFTLFQHCIERLSLHTQILTPTNLEAHSPAALR
jgi:hypothetical protein